MIKYINNTSFSLNDLSFGQFNNPEYLNNLIKSDYCDYYILSVADEISSAEVLDIINEYNYSNGNDVIVFCENGPSIEYSDDYFLCHPDIKPAAIMFSHKVISDIGSYNRLLTSGCQCEFIMRCLKHEAVTFIPCSGITNIPPITAEYVRTYAYMLARSFIDLKNLGVLNDIFSSLSSYFNNFCLLNDFNNYLNDFIENGTNNIDKETAPFFIISGDDTCYGMLKSFSKRLAAALSALGEAVETSDKSFGASRSGIPEKGKVYKAVIGFQSAGITSDYINSFSCPKFQFWFDNPVFFNDMKTLIPANGLVLCQDGDYADYINRYIKPDSAIHFPPAGSIAQGNYINQKDRSLDTVFIGTYHRPDLSQLGGIPDKLMDTAKAVIDILITKPELTLEEAFTEAVNNAESLTLPSLSELTAAYSDIHTILNLLSPVLRYVTAFYRHTVIKTLIDSDIKIHVYGDSWNNWTDTSKENLIIHKALSPDMVNEIYGDTKIALNIMSWHKNGMTERIADIMMSGAICVTDSTDYICEHFENKKELVIYNLEKLQSLPDMIYELLKDDDKREYIAQNGIKNATKNHTWINRAEKIIRLADGR